MDTATQESTQSVLQFQRWAASAWYILRTPWATAFCIAVLGAVIGLGLVIPQQPPGVGPAARAAWVAGLPLPFQTWGDLLYSLGLAQVFHSLWFWLPLALLFLNSLLAVADYGPGSWQRLGSLTPALTWQHPLARRVEQSVRLPESPDIFLADLKATLARQGFYIYPSSGTDERTIGAARRRQSWLGLPALYISLIVATIAALVSYHLARLDDFTLVPFLPTESRLLTGQIELAGFDGGSSTGQIIYRQDGGEQILAWRLYLPVFFRNVLVWPFATEPVLTVEVRDQAGNLLKLIPVQENLLPTERLTLLRDTPNDPLYFSIPSADLAVQVVPNPDAPDQSFSVRIRRGSTAFPSDAIQIQADQAFDLDGLTATVIPTYDLKVVAYRDPALPLYLIAFILAVAGGVTFLLPPRQLWLVPEVKGRGGQLYGVVEHVGSETEAIQFLKQLFQNETSPAPPVSSKAASPPA